MRIVGVLALGGALVVAGLLVAARWLVVWDPLPVRSGAIVVLAGSIPDRTLEAADLYLAGRAPLVVLTREVRRHGESTLRRRGVRLPESDETMRVALVQLGVPARAIVVLRRRNRSTQSEARTIARWACRERLESVIVVTSRAHSRRARMILHRALGPGVRLVMRPARYDVFPVARWWRVRTASKEVLSEYEKLAHWWLRERWETAACGGLAPR